MKNFRYLLAMALMLLAGAGAYAQQRSITAVLKDGSNGEPVSFATVTITKQGQKVHRDA